MKKSKSIRLVLLGSTSLALAACDEAPPPDGRFFRTVAECTAVMGEAACREGIEQSQKKAATEAPRFDRKEACETEFGAGNCESRSTAGVGSFFMPMMMGYMLGNAFSQPVYRGPNNGAMVNSGGKLFNVGRFAGAGRAAAFQPGQVTQIRRGGFGRSASAFRTSSGS